MKHDSVIFTDTLPDARKAVPERGRLSCDRLIGGGVPADEKYGQENTSNSDVTIPGPHRSAPGGYVVPARIVGTSDAAMALRHSIARAAQNSPTRALIVGAEGSGTRHLAAGLHADSGARGELVHLDCSALSATSLPAWLFGSRLKDDGLLTRARGGTLVLEALEQIPVAVQKQILSTVYKVVFLEPSQFGKTTGLIGLVAGKLSNHLESGTIDHDLYTMLSESLVIVPSLRERQSDALDIARHHVASLNRETGCAKELSEETLERMRAYDWPGNVEELKSTIRALYFATKHSPLIEPDERVAPALRGADACLASALVGRSAWDVQRLLLMETLSATGGDKKRTAHVLGISLKTLYNRLHAYS